MAINVTFITKDGVEHKVEALEGESLLETAHRNGVELEGQCEGSLACSTCHVVVLDEEVYGKLPEKEEEEEDMLDMAFGLEEFSRLGCQIIVTQELDGAKFKIPGSR